MHDLAFCLQHIKLPSRYPRFDSGCFLYTQIYTACTEALTSCGQTTDISGTLKTGIYCSLHEVICDKCSRFMMESTMPKNGFSTASVIAIVLRQLNISHLGDGNQMKRPFSLLMKIYNCTAID